MYGYAEDSAFMKGYHARLDGYSVLDNPYSELFDPDDWDDWINGWVDAYWIDGWVDASNIIDSWRKA